MPGDPRDHADTPPGILTSRQKCANHAGLPTETASTHGEPDRIPWTITAESS